MKEISLLGIDLAKNSFSLHGVDNKGRVVLRKTINRAGLLPFVMGLKRCRIAMEACGSSHFWGRKFQALGHKVDIIAAQHVKPFARKQKNDANDAEAITEAAQRPSMNYVAVKAEWQQELQSLHRARSLAIKMRIEVSNQTRGLLLEYGVTIPQGLGRFEKALILILSDKKLSDDLQVIVSKNFEHYRDLRESEKYYTSRLTQIAKQSEDCLRLMRVPGVGPMIATAFVSSVGNPRVFKNGRHLAAWLGVVPRQHSTGGEVKLMGITKSGDEQLRSIMVQGAKSCLINSVRKTKCDPWKEEARSLLSKKASNVAAIALVNKMCRTMWHLMTYKVEFNPAH